MAAKATTKGLLKFEVRNSFTGDVQFVAEIEADETSPLGFKLGLAVKWAIGNSANLISADLGGANLYGANLRGANLGGANLYGANLISANLYGANLISANLRGANIYGADLRSANLRSADLGGADLRSANLISADLGGANLYGANLRGANIASAKNAELAIARTRILPEGDIIGWKKCKNDVIAKLLIPAAAKRSHAFGRKCRAEYVDCIEIFGADKGVSLHDDKTEYVAGQRVTPDAFDDNWQEGCASGIHFYLSRIEAEAHS
jgi:hypothetical protein